MSETAGLFCITCIVRIAIADERAVKILPTRVISMLPGATRRIREDNLIVLSAHRPIPDCLHFVLACWAGLDRRFIHRQYIAASDIPQLRLDNRPQQINFAFSQASKRGAAQRNTCLLQACAC
jgi:hypothetical protein